MKHVYKVVIAIIALVVIAFIFYPNIHTYRITDDGVMRVNKITQKVSYFSFTSEKYSGEWIELRKK